MHSCRAMNLGAVKIKIKCNCLLIHAVIYYMTAVFWDLLF